jgi:hypothetical protein
MVMAGRTGTGWTIGAAGASAGAGARMSADTSTRGSASEASGSGSLSELIPLVFETADVSG